MSRAVMAVSIWALAASASVAAAPTVDRVDVVEFGLYQTRKVEEIPAPDAPMGHLNSVTDVRLLQTLDEFCPRLGVTFGVRYSVVGSPPGSPVDLRMVTRFPQPGQTNPQGRRFDKTEYVAGKVVGETSFRSFTFDATWEMVPGVWTFEFHHGGRRLAEKHFTVLASCTIS